MIHLALYIYLYAFFIEQICSILLQKCVCRVIGDLTCLCVLLIITFKKVVCLSVCSIREKLLAWFSRDLVEGLSSGQGIIHWFRCRFKYYDKAFVLHAYGFGVVEKMKMIFRLGWSTWTPLHSGTAINVMFKRSEKQDPTRLPCSIHVVLT